MVSSISVAVKSRQQNCPIEFAKVYKVVQKFLICTYFVNEVESTFNSDPRSLKERNPKAWRASWLPSWQRRGCEWKRWRLLRGI